MSGNSDELPFDGVERVTSMDEIEEGDELTVLSNTTPNRGEMLVESAEVSDVGTEGFAGLTTIETDDEINTTSSLQDLVSQSTESDLETTATFRRDDTGFFDDPIEAPQDKKRLRPVDIQREPDGEFAPPPAKVSAAPSSSARRGPDGEFVSNDLRDIEDIGRQDRTGLFDLF